MSGMDEHGNKVIDSNQIVKQLRRIVNMSDGNIAETNINEDLFA